MRQLRKSQGPPAGPSIEPFVGKLDTRAVSQPLSISFLHSHRSSHSCSFPFSSIPASATSTSLPRGLFGPVSSSSSYTDRRLIYVIMQSYRDTRHYPRKPWDGVYSKISVIIGRMFHRSCTLPSSFLLPRTFMLPLYRDIPLTRLVSHYIFRTALFQAMMHKSCARICDRCARSRARAR